MLETCSAFANVESLSEHPRKFSIGFLIWIDILEVASIQLNFHKPPCSFRAVMISHAIVCKQASDWSTQWALPGPAIGGESTNTECNYLLIMISDRQRLRRVIG